MIDSVHLGKPGRWVPRQWEAKILDRDGTLDMHLVERPGRSISGQRGQL